MLTIEQVKELVLKAANGVEITRQNYVQIADMVYKEDKHYGHIYELVKDFTNKQKQALLDYLFDDLKLPEMLEYDKYEKMKETTKDWSCLAISVVLMRQSHDAEYKAIVDYIANVDITN